MKKEKEILLSDLQNLLSSKLKGQTKVKAIGYLEKNKNNFNEENLKEILSKKFIPTNKYTKSQQEFEEIKNKLKINITKSQSNIKNKFKKKAQMKKNFFKSSSSEDSFQKVNETTLNTKKKDSMLSDKKSVQKKSSKNSLMKSKVFKNSKKEKNSGDFQLDISKVELNDQTQFLDDDNLLQYLNDEKPVINKKNHDKKKSQTNRDTFFNDSDSDRIDNNKDEKQNQKNKKNIQLISKDSSEDEEESKSSNNTESNQKSNSSIQEENEENDIKNNTSIDQNRKSKKEKPKKQKQIINKKQTGDILKCELIYELIEDQSSEQSLQKISFQYKNLLKIEQSENEDEFEILGFYGQKKCVIQSVEEWLETKIKIDQNKESKFLLFVGKTESKIAAFVIADDKLFVNPYEKNCHLIDFIKILQDVSFKVRLCLNPNIEINEGETPFNVKKKGRIIENRAQKQNYKLTITKLEEKNKSEQNNFDQLFIWNQFLVKVEVNYTKKNEDRMIEVQEFKQDTFINLGISKKKLIKIEKYPNYLKKNISRLIESKTLTEVAQDILDKVEQHIQNKQEKILFQEKIQQILEESKKQDDEPMETILDEKLNDSEENQDSTYKLNYKSFINIKTSEEIFKEGFQKIIECLEQIQIKKSDEKIQSAIVTLEFYQIGFPQDSNNQISSFQINKTNIQGTFLLQEITEKNISVHKLLAFNEKQGLIFISQGNEKTYKILQFSIGENDKVEISRFHDYPTERQFYVDQQNQNFLILTNEGAQIQVNKIEKNFKIQNVKTINGICKQKVSDKGQGTQYQIENINQYMFYGQQKKIIFMNQDREIFKTSSNQQKAQIKILKKSVFKDNTVKEQFFRTEDNEFYDEFITSINNNYLILKYKKGIDIYDQNFQFQTKINLEGIFIEAQVIEYNDRQYLIVLYKEGLKCYSFEGECNAGKRNHKTLGKEKEKPKGNSSIDYFYSAIKKYGSNAPYQEEVIEKKILQIDKSILKKLKQYIKKIRYFKNLITTENISDDIGETIKWRNFNFMIKTRAPLHIASIEQKQLYPLKNGINNRIGIQRALQQLQQNNNQQEIYFHQQIKVVLDEIKFGVYEDILNEQVFDELKVICTMGRQSLGKSYLLNRLFGTRFNVDSKRCTDGLWLSMSAEEIKGKHILYVIIDCEGLFNIRRVLEEELQLVSVCTGISNLTIFNSENNFDRKLDQFFGQLGKQSIKHGNLKYYQGALLFLIRDITKSDKDDVLDDFQNNIEQKLIKNQNIEEKTFKKIFYDAMTSFENKDDFNEDVEDLKTDIITSQINPNKLNSKSFIQSFKLLLAKIYFNDDQDVDLAMLRMKLDEKYINSKKIFLEGNEFLNKQTKKLDLKKLLNCKIDVNQRDTNFKKQDWQGEKYQFENKIHPLNKAQHDSFRIIFSKQIKYDIKKHDEWFKSYFLFCETFIKERINLVVQKFKDQFQQEQSYRQEIEQKIKSLEQELSQTLKLYTICQYKGQKCKFCRRNCVQKKNHEGVCNCYTDHSCQEQCSIENCKKQNFQCSKYYGHEDGKHLCDKSNHYCIHQCSIQDCKEQCKLQQGHKNEDHTCQGQHECPQKCSLESCQEQCQHSLENKDHKHQCQNYECPFTCELCDKKCIFPDHFHNDYIIQKQKKKLKIELDGTTYKFDHHNCGGEHRCQQLCQQDGICECNYINISKQKNTTNNKTFTYDYTEQTEKRNSCNIQIPKFKKKHKNKHDCEKEQPHRCNNQCPECKIYCELDYGHEGPHKNGLHRNKDNAIYSSMKKDVVIEIKQDNEVYTFNIGDTAENERCMSSCINKGRSHVHLVECKGDQYCHQIELGEYKAKHIHQQLDKEGTKQYDQLLCQAFFDYYNWLPPAEGEEQDKINQCSFACTHYEHKKNNEMVYCQNQAWHEGDHFVGHVHKTIYEKIQVAFILDCTQSMGVYIEGTKRAIGRIIKTFIDQYKDQNKIEFGVVAYKDHFKSGDWDKDRPIKTQEFTDEKKCKQFVGQLKEGGGFDPPEAVVDGFQGVIDLAWTEGSLKFVFLVTDGPPHGEQYGCNLNDQFPEGCPCNLDFHTIIQVINELNIKFRFVKIGDLVNRFSQFLADNVKEYDVLELDQNIQLENIVTESLFEDLKNEYFEIKQQGVIK